MYIKREKPRRLPFLPEFEKALKETQFFASFDYLLPYWHLHFETIVMELLPTVRGKAEHFPMVGHDKTKGP